MYSLESVKTHYCSKVDSSELYNKISNLHGSKAHSCRRELFSLLDRLISNEPCCYWDEDVYNQTISMLEKQFDECPAIVVNEQMVEYFLMGYSAYRQVTDTINEFSNLNEYPTIKNRQYRIPTYISIVEGCITNLFRFVALLLNQTVKDRDYSTNYTLNSLCELLNANEFKRATQYVNVDIRNAINHGGIIFEEDGNIMNFHYIKSHKSFSKSISSYEFDSLIDRVYDTASAILLSVSVFMNNHWNCVAVELSKKTYAAFSLLCLELSIPTVECRYMFDVLNKKQLNAGFYIFNTDRTFILQVAIDAAIQIYARYDDYEQYYLTFSGEILQTSWIRFTNKEVRDIINDARSINDVIQNANKRKDIVIFEPSTENINLQEIKYFRFPNYRENNFKIINIEDISTEDRKRLKCQLYIGDIASKSEILQIIWKGIKWLNTVRNVDSLTIHHKNGLMAADTLYIKVYKHDSRKSKELLPSNENFVCLVNYNVDGINTIKNGGLTEKIWEQFYHEKIGQLDIAWREEKYFARTVKKIGANELCPCGSGKKFKKCCRGKGIYD